MSRHDAPPETDVQRQAREWWTDRLGACAVGWGRDRHGKFLSEFARNAEAAWAAALNTRAASGGDSLVSKPSAPHAANNAISPTVRTKVGSVGLNEPFGNPEQFDVNEPSGDSGQLASLEQRAEDLLRAARSGWFDANDPVPHGAAIRAITAALANQQGVDGNPGIELHPATDDLVTRFSDALRSKLAAAERKYGYSDGWLNPNWMDECRQKLAEHVAKGDPRDVAAYCAFLWHHGQATAVTQPAGDVGSSP